MNSINSISKVFLVFLFLISCKEEIKESADSVSSTVLSEERLKNSGIEFGFPEERELTSLFSAKGKIVVLQQDQAVITSKIDGIIENIFVKEGDKVKKGQPVCQISSQAIIQIQQDYHNYKAEKEFLEKEYARQKELSSEKIGALKDLQATESKYKIALANFKGSYSKMKLLGIDSNPSSEDFKSSAIIYAPMSGYLVKLNTSIGTSTTAGINLGQIYNLDDPHADVFVFSKDINFVQEGQNVKVEFINENHQVADGKVEFITRSMDEETKTVLVHVLFTPPAGIRIIPDMQLNVSFPVKTENKLTVPLDAVYDEGNAHYIYLVKEDKKNNFIFEPVAVKLGIEDNNLVQISPEIDIAISTKIVTKGAALLYAELNGSEEE
jgi:cobalt-zinc-cadmium efflux system membrane fusion protein